MMTSKFAFWRRRTADSLPSPAETVPEQSTASAPPASLTLDLDIAPTDPLLAYLAGNSSPFEVERLELDSAALRTLKAADVSVAVPLVSQGDLIGLINLGPRRSEQEYSGEDRKLLSDLAIHAAPAVRVAQLVQQQRLEAVRRERIENELRVARVIQQTLLPRALPDLDGWIMAAYWQPASAVGGDFYDFITLPDGRLAIIIADVTDHGVPAALVMATTRTMLRAAAERLITPGAVLERVNNVLYPDIPPKMFVTCLYAVLDPASGHLQYANAGHNLPFVQRRNSVDEMRATGMPLGLLPGMSYEEKETVLDQGDRLLLYSDGLVEAHNPAREMFSTPRLQALLGQTLTEDDLNASLLTDLSVFTGREWEQEDDVTMVTIKRLSASGPDWRTLAQFETPSQPGNERQVMAQVVEIVQPLGVPGAQLERLKTAVAEAAMNAMEHGNHYDPDKPVQVEVRQAAGQIGIHITDRGGGSAIPTETTPDLEAKLAGLQSPRGWGLFLIKSMVDEMNVISDDHHHTLELIFNLEGDPHASASA